MIVCRWRAGGSWCTRVVVGWIAYSDDDDDAQWTECMYIFVNFYIISS